MNGKHKETDNKKGWLWKERYITNMSFIQMSYNKLLIQVQIEIDIVMRR